MTIKDLWQFSAANSFIQESNFTLMELQDALNRIIA